MYSTEIILSKFTLYAYRYMRNTSVVVYTSVYSAIVDFHFIFLVIYILYGLTILPIILFKFYDYITVSTCKATIVSLVYHNPTKCYDITGMYLLMPQLLESSFSYTGIVPVNYFKSYKTASHCRFIRYIYRYTSSPI